MPNKYKADTRKYSIRLETAKVEFLKQIYGEESFTNLIERLIDERVEGIMQAPKKISSPIIRIGGKALIAQRIVELMPPHKVYCDLFGGAGHILLGKDPSISKLEIFNDKSGDIINLFQVIKDRPLDLRAMILQIPCSRAVYNKMKSLPVPEDKVERAAWYFYLIRNSFFGDMRSGWRASNRNNVPKTVQRIADELYWISERLKHVTLECSDWKYMLRKYGNDKDALLYIDPPYLIHGKKHGIYELPFTTEDNRELAMRLRELPCKIMVSHYENKLFNRYYSGWRVERIHWYKAAGAIIERQEIDQEGNLITVKEKPKVVENLYLNY